MLLFGVGVAHGLHELALRTCHDGLDGIHLEFVLLPTSHDWVDRESTKHLFCVIYNFTGHVVSEVFANVAVELLKALTHQVDRLVCDLADVPNGLESFTKLGCLLGSIRQTKTLADPVSGFFQRLSNLVEVETFLQLVKRLEAFSSALLESIVLEM